jgi:hypothetical protein
MPLPDYGWTEEQAQGLFERLNLEGGPPAWKREHLRSFWHPTFGMTVARLVTNRSPFRP